MNPVYRFIKEAEFDLPDLQTNPKNKMTRLTKNLVWGVKVDGEPISDNGILFKLDPNKGYEIVGDNNGNVASCVDLTNKVVKNMRGVGALATMRSDGTVPHLTPLFKYKGKYYLRSGTHKYSDPYDSLEEIGKRWFKSDSSYPVPAYVDFYDLPDGTIINEKDLRKVIDEVKRKSKKSYRRDYTDREGYKKEKKANKSISFPKEEIDSLKGKDYLYTTRVSDDFDKYSLGDSVNTPWGDKYTVTSEDIYDDVKKHKFYKELTPKQKKLLKVYDKIKLIGLKKQAGKLYTYVDPEAYLSKGILSARLAPEDVLMRRYPNSGAKNKKELLEIMQTRFKDDKDRPNLIYALSSPIPDTANSRLLRFRANHKLVSYETDKIKDLVKLLKRRYRKPPIEVKDVEPRKYVQWGRDPKDAGAFFYAPVYKVLTESGKIDPELLTIKD